MTCFHCGGYTVEGEIECADCKAKGKERSYLMAKEKMTEWTAAVTIANLISRLSSVTTRDGSLLKDRELEALRMAIDAMNKPKSSQQEEPMADMKNILMRILELIEQKNTAQASIQNPIEALDAMIHTAKRLGANLERRRNEAAWEKATEDWNVTAERAPTKKDADRHGRILVVGVNIEGVTWQELVDVDYVIENPVDYPYWLPMPSIPERISV